MSHHRKPKPAANPLWAPHPLRRPDIDIAPCILYQDPDVVALNKPFNLPSTGHDLRDPNCAQWLLAEHLRRPVWAIHQLDRQTSGVLLFVRRKTLVEPWHRRIKPPTGQKTYWALCHGTPSWDALDIRAPIGWHNDLYGVTPDGKDAHTHARLLGYSQDRRFASLALTLLTGRTHQIRVHLAHIGHPLVGEAYYHVCTLHPRQALHAASVRFFDGKPPPGFFAPLPSDLLELAAHLGVQAPSEAELAGD